MNVQTIWFMKGGRMHGHPHSLTTIHSAQSIPHGRSTCNNIPRRLNQILWFHFCWRNDNKYNMFLLPGRKENRLLSKSRNPFWPTSNGQQMGSRAITDLRECSTGKGNISWSFVIRCDNTKSPEGTSEVSPKQIWRTRGQELFSLASGQHERNLEDIKLPTKRSTCGMLSGWFKGTIYSSPDIELNGTSSWVEQLVKSVMQEGEEVLLFLWQL